MTYASRLLSPVRFAGHRIISRSASRVASASGVATATVTSVSAVSMRGQLITGLRPLITSTLSVTTLRISTSFSSPSL